MAKTVIVGGGIIGLFTAYYLMREGKEVCIMDKSDLQSTCSTGNAGMIVPSHIIPLASPGAVGKGIKWLFSRKSPFYIHPKLDKKLLDWCLLFFRSSNVRHVERSVPYLKSLSILSKALYLDFDEEHSNADIGLQKGGLLMLYLGHRAGIEEIEAAHLAQHHGLDAEILDASEIENLEPNVKTAAMGGVYYPGDAHLKPAVLQQFLINYLKENGAEILTETEVRDFQIENGKIAKVIIDNGEITANEVIICGGAWSGLIADKLKLKLPMMGGKGYTFWQYNQPELKQATILTEARVSVSPYGEKVRFGGTMEITGTDESVNLRRVQGIFESINRYYPDFESKASDVKDIWSGLRPCSPDGLPYIGQSTKYDNLYFGTGHSMMGISLAPATGKILAELIINKHAPIPLDGFSPERFSRR